MSKTVYTPRIGSEIFETSVMKTDEVYIFIKAATERGIDLETAYDDMRMIDDILHLKKIHFAIHGEIKRTKAGYAEVNNKKIHFGSLMKMYYTFTVYVKQGRYKIEFTSIEFQYYPTDLNPMPGKVLAEQMFSKQEFYKSNGKPHPKNEGFMIELDATFKRTGDALKKAMTTADDW